MNDARTNDTITYPGFPMPQIHNIDTLTLETIGPTDTDTKL